MSSTFVANRITLFLISSSVVLALLFIAAVTFFQPVH